MKKLPNEKGQSLMEMGLTMVFLLLFLSGIVEFARVFMIYSALRVGSQEGAFYAMVRPDDLEGIEKRARDATDTPIDLHDTEKVTVQVEHYMNPSGRKEAKVTVSYNFDITMPFLGAVLGTQQIPLNATSVVAVMESIKNLPLPSYDYPEYSESVSAPTENSSDDSASSYPPPSDNSTNAYPYL